MLAFLDSLCGALIARDADRIRLQLAHPLAHALPRSVREEAIAIANGHRRAFVAPLHTLRLYHQTAHLLGARVDPAIHRHAGNGSQGSEMPQMELPLEHVSTR